MRWMVLAAGLVGCGGGDGAGTPEGAPTWHQDVAPLVADRCGGCHQEGGIAPFSVQDYETAAAWAPAMADSVRAGRMPPFFAVESDDCEMGIGFRDDLRLSDAEKDLLDAWVDAGAPEGDPDAAAPAPLRAVDHLEDPDAIVSLPSPFAVSGDRDLYQCFRIPLENTSDLWLDGLEVLPDNELVVHHVLVWNDPGDGSAAKVGPDGSYPCSGEPDVWPTELIAAWTPGGSPMRAPGDSGTLIHPGASLVVNVHYHPTGNTTELDQTRLALSWKDQQPTNHVTWYLVDLPFGAEVEPGPNDRGGPEFRIPAGASDHTETVSLWIPPYIPFDLPVFAITPHMHYLGREMLVTVRRPEGDDECLIHTPGYRFDFQTAYVYDGATGPLPVLRPGDTVEVRCTYDNSEANPFLDLQLEAAGTSAPEDVGWGEETNDEMCMAMVGLILPPIDWLELL